MWVALLALGCALPAQARWQWSEPQEAAPAQAGVFPHLDASGRQALAVAGDTVALAWSDTGKPRCFITLKTASGFQTRSFGQGECFEPAVAALDEKRFLLTWEDEAGVRAAIADAAVIGPALTLAPAGGHAVIHRHPQLGIHAAWSSTEGRWRRIWHAHLHETKGRLMADAPQPADAAPPADDQMYPTLAAPPQALVLAWEDRRHGHTVVYASHSRDFHAWSAPLRVSQNPTGKQGGTLGRGTGAMRPVLAAYGQHLMAVWLDKRDFLSGYDVYGAVSPDQGLHFGANVKVQDSFGDSIAQWRPAIAGNQRGDLAIAWDDDRDGSADIWLTWPQDKALGSAYAENAAAAAGPNQQTDPALALDDAGNLHLAWLERDATGVIRLMYKLGRPKTEK